jgi:hypothetical protein
MDRVLSPGGDVIIVEPNDNGLFSIIKAFEHEERSDNEGFISTRDIDRFFSNLNYAVDVSYYTVSMPYVRAKYLSANYLMRATKPGQTTTAHASPIEPSQVFHCPVTRRPLRFAGDLATTEDGSHTYHVIAGLPVLLPEGDLRELAETALKQRHAGAPADRDAVLVPAL